MNRQVMINIIIGAAAATILAGYWFFAYRPLAGHLAGRQQELSLRQKEMADARNLLEHYGEFAARGARVQMERRRLDESLPVQSRIPEVLKAVTSAAAECNIRDFQFVPRPMADKKTYWEQPVKISMTCNYHALGLFISRLSGLPRLMTARGVQITGRDKTGKSDSISAEMTLVVYVRNQP